MAVHHRGGLGGWRDAGRLRLCPGDPARERGAMCGTAWAFSSIRVGAEAGQAGTAIWKRVDRGGAEQSRLWSAGALEGYGLPQSLRTGQTGWVVNVVVDASMDD